MVTAHRIVRAFGLLLLLLAWSAHRAEATTYTVDDPGNPSPTTGSLTLAQAIADVNAGSGGDTIVFSIPSGGSSTVTISIGSTSLPQITQSVTINGSTEQTNASASLIVDGTGGPTNEVGFDFESGSSGSTLLGVQIQNFPGPGVFIASAASATIGGTSSGQGCVISGNGGSGISNQGSVTVQGCIIGPNAAGTAAFANGVNGITNTGTCNVESGCLISGNTGNGISNSAGGTCTVTSSYIGTGITGTAALGNGTNGILSSGTGTATNIVSGNLISGNSNAGIFNQSGATCNVGPGYIGTDVSGNNALANTIGIENTDAGSTCAIVGTVTVQNVPTCNIAGNTNQGLLNVNGAAVTAQGCSFGSTINGGLSFLGNGIGIENSGAGSTCQLLAIGAAEVGCDVLENSTQGVLNHNGATLSMTGCSVFSATIPGTSLVPTPTGIENDVGSTLHMTDSGVGGCSSVGILNEGTTTLVGGGVNHTGNNVFPPNANAHAIENTGAGASLTIGVNPVDGNACTLSNNIQGILNQSGATCTITGATIGDSIGAGISNQGTCTVEGSFIGVGADGSTSMPNAIGIQNGGAGCTCSIGGTAAGAACVISNNGSGIQMGSGAAVTVSHCTFSNNGGAIVDAGGDNGTDAISNCVFHGNTGTDGAALTINSAATVTDCTFIGNTASTGGAVDVQSKGLALTNCSFSGNTSYAIGTAGSANGATQNVTLTNCILFGDGTNNTEISSAPPTSLSINHSVVPGAVTNGVNGNIVADPKYVNAAAGDLSLDPASPCAGAGTSTNAPVQDLNGVSWVPGPNPNMGALSATGIGITTATALKSSLNPSGVSTAVTITATVAPNTGTGTPTGTVTFTDNTAVLQQVPLSGGQASVTLSNATAGPHVIVATYSGDANFFGSTSSSLTQTVLPTGTASSSTSLQASNITIDQGDSVTLTATVTATSLQQTPTGTVTFLDGGSALGPAVTLSSGAASLSVNTLGPGAHRITAVYGGDNVFAASTSSTVTEQVDTFTLTLGSDSNTITIPGTLQFSVTAGAGGFSSPVTFNAHGLPAGFTATFKPAQVTPGNGSATTTMTVTGSGTAKLASSLALGFAGSLLLCLRRRTRLNARAWLPLVTALLIMGFVAGCGGGVGNMGFSRVTSSSSSSSGASSSSNTFTFTVTATSGNTVSSTAVHAHVL